MANDITTGIPNAKIMMQALMRQMTAIESGTVDGKQVRDMNNTVKQVMGIINSGIESKKVDLAYRREDAKGIKKAIDVSTSSNKQLIEEKPFLENLYNVKILLRQYVQTEYPGDYERQKIMPTPKELEADPKYKPLVTAIIDIHGGFERVADILGFTYKK